jgi:hypothetical protein
VCRTGDLGSAHYVEAHAANHIRARLNFDINAHGDTRALFALFPVATTHR